MNERLNIIFTLSGTENLRIRRVENADIQILQEICDAWIEKGFFEGDTLPFDYVEQCLKAGDLPPISNADKQNYALFAVEDDDKIIGLFDLYDGFPEVNSAWISLFLLDIEYRSRGIGKRLIRVISNECRKTGFKSLGLAVSMNNRIALKFWVNSDFKEISGIYGDMKYPVMGLKMKL
jgi:diamine N-acetyltransferase